MMQIIICKKKNKQTWKIYNVHHVFFPQRGENQKLDLFLQFINSRKIKASKVYPNKVHLIYVREWTIKDGVGWGFFQTKQHVIVGECRK